VDQSVQSRQLIYDFCAARSLQYWPSEANFVLVRVGPAAPEVVRDVAARGVLIRDRSTQPGCGGCIRITAGVADHTRAALTALEAALATRNR
jgi:histidinol-phosphate aminotransferase